MSHLFSPDQIKKMANADSPLLPENLKALFAEQNIQKIKKISFFSDAEKELFKDISEMQNRNEQLKQEIHKAKLNEVYTKYKIVK